jgi:bacteriocin biosynthesis cyclodehydratase domain-containing protein
MSQSESGLPRRLKLLAGLPVLRRGDHEIQLGLDPRHAVVIEGVTETVAESIRRLDGHARTQQLLERTPADDRPALIALLRELLEIGMIEDATESGAPCRLAADATTWALRTGSRPSQLAGSRKSASVLVHGSGRIGVAVASLLVAAGIGAVEVQAEGLVAPEDTGCGYLMSDVGKPRRAAARTALERQGPARRAVNPDLVVITDSAVPAPEFVAGLLAGSVPHLAARVREGVGIVGPFVVPGRSSCLSCADLHRADLDSSWPTVAAQLAGRTQTADLTCAHATAAFAVEQVLQALAWLATGDRRPPTWNATIEFDAFHGRLEHRSWAPHPCCSCGVRRL